MSAFNTETTEIQYVGNKPVSASNPLSAFCPITKEIAVTGVRKLEITCVGKIANTGDMKIVNKDVSENRKNWCQGSMKHWCQEYNYGKDRYQENKKL